MHLKKGEQQTMALSETTATDSSRYLHPEEPKDKIREDLPQDHTKENPKGNPEYILRKLFLSHE